MNENILSLTYFIPETILGLGILVYLLALTFIKSSKIIAGFAYVIFVLVLASLTPQLAVVTAYPLFHHLLETNFLNSIFRGLAGLSALIWSFFVFKTHDQEEQAGATMVLFILTALLGVHIMLLAQNIMVLVLGIELLSTSSSVLVAINRHGKLESEAALNYIIFVAFSAGMMILGTSYLYGFAHSLQISTIAAAVTSTPNDLWLIFGTGLFLAGLAFKVAAVPLHFWAPDVYAGAPLPVTAFLATVSKIASLVVLVKFLMMLAPATWLSAVLWGMALAGMLLGNLGALRQTQLKRLLAYSSIAHTGYMLVGLATLTAAGFFAGIFYMVIYLLATVAAFVLLLFLGDNDDFAVLKGLFWRNPYLASAFTIVLATLTGLPPTAGFIGKFYLFSAAINHGFVVLSAVGLIISVVSLIYYMNLVRMMFQKTDGEISAEISSFGLAQLLVMLAAVALLYLGLYWVPLENLVKAALG